MQGKMHDRVVEMRLCFFSGKVGDYKVLFKSTRKCRSTRRAEQYRLYIKFALADVDDLDILEEVYRTVYRLTRVELEK